MRSIKKGKKTVKILFFAAILLTATTAMVISIHNQNTYPLLNQYIMGVSQGSSSIIHEKTLYISSDYNFTENIYEKIVVTADNIVIDGKGYTLQGSWDGCGFNLTGRSNVTIKNVLAKWWDYDFYIKSGFNNTLSGNTALASWGHGFYLDSSSNNTISGNTADNWEIGFYLYNSSNNTISGNTGNSFYLDSSSNNTISGNTGNDFYLDSSSNNTLSGNTVTANYYNRGRFFLSDSGNNSLSGNVMVRCGLFVSGSLVSLASNVVDQSNTVNGGVLYYYVSESGLSPANFTNAGQVMLVNCSDSEISDLSISNTYAGIEVHYSSNITISRNSISSNYYGIYMSNSNNNNLSGNTANNNINGRGFYLDSSSYNTLSDNTAKDNAYGGFILKGSNYNNLSGNTAANNGWYGDASHGWGGFQLSGSSYNNLSGNTAAYNYEGFVLQSSSHNNITGNTIVNFLGEGFDIDLSSVDNIIENNTVVSMAPSLLAALVYGECISFYFYQQNKPSVSDFLIVGLLVTLVTVALVCSVVVSRRRKVVGADEGVWKLPRDAFLVGTVGGIMGSVTAVVGIIWEIVVNAFLTEINIYLGQLGYYTIFFYPLMPYIHYSGEPFPPLLLAFYPSASPFYVLSLILSTSLILTSVLIGIGLYGTYKAGGGAMGIVGLIFSIIGTTSGALLIIMGNLTTGYMYTRALVEMTTAPFWPVPTPNFPLVWIGFLILGVTFILLGAASIRVREITEKPWTSSAAGILGIIGAVFFIIGSLWNILLIIGFGLIFVAFILWVVVFFSSRVL